MGLFRNVFLKRELFLLQTFELASFKNIILLRGCSLLQCVLCEINKDFAIEIINVFFSFAQDEILGSPQD